MSATAQTQTATADTSNVFAVNQTVQFKAYATPPKPGESAPFVAGDLLTLTAPGTDTSAENYEATRITDGMKATVYFDEIESYTPPAEVTSPEKKTKKAAKTPEEKAAAEAANAEAKAKKEAEAAAKKAEAEAEANKPIVLTESVKALVSDDPKATLEAGEALAKQIDTSEYTLGGVLAFVKQGNLQASVLGDDGKPKYSADKDGFEKYITENLSCGYRKALYLIKNYRKFSSLNISEEDVSEIGWTKAMLMEGVIDDSNKEELLAIAKDPTKNKADVEAKVKALKVNAGTDTNTNTRGVRIAFAFTLYNNDGEAARAIIEQAITTLPAEDQKDEKAAQNKAFSKILTEWSQLTAAARAAAAPAPAPAPAAESAPAVSDASAA